MDEYAKFRGLIPVKLSVIGVPISGKTDLSNSVKYLANVKTVHMKEVLDYVKSLNNSLSEQIIH